MAISFTGTINSQLPMAQDTDATKTLPKKLFTDKIWEDLLLTREEQMWDCGLEELERRQCKLIQNNQYHCLWKSTDRESTMCH